MRKVTLFCLLAAGVPFGCGGTREAAAPRSSSLHSEAEGVLAMRAPRYSGTGEQADALRFVKTEVAAWTVRRKTATNALIAKYEAARSHVAASPGVAALYGDVAQLLYDFCREFNDAGASSATDAIRADPAMHDAYLGALVAATVPQLDRAISEAEKCLALARASEARTIIQCRATRQAAALLRGKASPTVHGLDGATRL